MEREYFAAPKGVKTKDKNYQDAKRSLDNYINQLKFHYGLSDEELSSLVKELFGTKADRKNSSKKWWQIWR